MGVETAGFGAYHTTQLLHEIAVLEDILRYSSSLSTTGATTDRNDPIGGDGVHDVSPLEPHRE